MSFETWTDVQVREAQERGEFDNLPGKGKPLPNIDEHDDMWWIKQWLRREDLSFTPPTIALRKSVEDTLAGIGHIRSEAKVREVIGELNQRIRDMNRVPPVDGPPPSLSVMDVDAILELWRERRPPFEAAEQEILAEAAAKRSASTAGARASDQRTPSRNRNRRRGISWLRRS